MVQTNGVFYISETYIPEAAWGVEHYKYSHLKFPLFTHEPPVIVAHAQQEFYPYLLKLVSELADLNLESRLILFGNTLAVEDLIELNNIYLPFYISTSEQVHDIETAIQKGLENSRLSKQNKVLLQLFKEQNIELKKVSQELEDKIKKRQLHLQETNERLQQANSKNQYLQKCLFAIHSAKSIMDLEHQVSALLADPYLISWFRILLNSNESNNLLDKKDLLNTYIFPLSNGQKKYGTIVYGRDTQRPFKRDERDFLDQMSESIALSIDRLLQIERNKELQSQWQATFNAVSDPLCLIDLNYNLKIANKKFMELYHERDKRNLKCHEVLFKRDTPCNGCERGSTFRIRSEQDSSIIYEVSSQGMMIEYQKCFFHVYHDISRQLHYERQLIESAKQAELGTISSSIAHELNNPLGGMLNFVQLIKMDLTGNEDFYPDILEIESAAQKCKAIVQNLLGFSRIDDYTTTKSLSICEVIQRAILIVELRTRALGIRIDFSSEAYKDIFIIGKFNQLAHVFCNVLQNSYESILEKRKTTADYSGTIHINLKVESRDVKIDIIDDGKGIPDDVLPYIFDPLFTTKDPDRHAGLGLPLARQILRDHGVNINVSSQKDGKTCVSFRFPRVVANKT
ncbi:MAG: HAMP domain-containing histidine kinase [Bdellovibrionaceae bacterium]|nr:HAMP domain-containing histidine kinase [Pseudobdellovibrionaceae bacterium]